MLAAIQPESWVTWIVVLAAMALAPFVLTMVTSFVKLVVVASLIRTAIGTPQVPPAIVINGLALILTIHIMWPVGEQATARYAELAQQQQEQRQGEGQNGAPAAQLSTGEMVDIALQATRQPLTAFLQKNARPANVEMFRRLRVSLAERNGPTSAPACTDTRPAWSELTILVPAFVLTELTEAFQIGFLIFLPFLVIDLVVSNVLLALGAQTLQATVVSLPLKLLVFVMVDGWSLLVQSLVRSYL